MKAANYGHQAPDVSTAFVSTNSICQGQQVPILWPLIFSTGHYISFAHTSFTWANLAQHNAGVTVAIIGFTRVSKPIRRIYSISDDGAPTTTDVANINAYLVPAPDVFIEQSTLPISDITPMDRGSSPVDGGNLLMTATELNDLHLSRQQRETFVRKICGSAELIRGLERFCLWIEDDNLREAESIQPIEQRINAVRQMRLKSPKLATRKGASHAHRFDEKRQKGDETIIAIPRISSANRPYLPAALLPEGTIITDLNFGMFDAQLWNLALLLSRIHLVWIATVCGRMKTDYRYSNKIGWNTFPVPPLTDGNKADLTQCAENILLAREACWPTTLADLYEPDMIPDDLRDAHERNDETLERIYIGRRFKNDTERLETLFKLHTEMVRKEKLKK